MCVFVCAYIYIYNICIYVYMYSYILVISFLYIFFPPPIIDSPAKRVALDENQHGALADPATILSVPLPVAPVASTSSFFSQPKQKKVLSLSLKSTNKCSPLPPRDGTALEDLVQDGTQAISPAITRQDANVGMTMVDGPKLPHFFAKPMAMLKFTTKKEKGVRRETIPRNAGLDNLGNTCYINSILQVLRGCALFLRILPPNRNSDIVLALSQLFDEMDCIEAHVVPPVCEGSASHSILLPSTSTGLDTNTVAPSSSIAVYVYSRTSAMHTLVPQICIPSYSGYPPPSHPIIIPDCFVNAHSIV